MKILDKLNLKDVRIIYPIIAFVVLVVYFYWEIQHSQEKRGIEALGQTRGLIMNQPLDLGRQDFSLPSIRSGEGGTPAVWRLSEAKSKVIVLNFWISTCPPCIEEMPSLERLSQLFKGKGVEVVAVSMDTSWEDVMSVLDPSATEMTVLLDNQGHTASSFGTFLYPETYIIKDNRILAKFISSQNWVDSNILSYLETLL